MEEEKKRKDRGREQEEIRGGQACRQRGERMGSSRGGSCKKSGRSEAKEGGGAQAAGRIAAPPRAQGDIPQHSRLGSGERSHVSHGLIRIAGLVGCEVCIENELRSERLLSTGQLGYIPEKAEFLHLYLMLQEQKLLLSAPVLGSALLTFD